MVVLLLALVAGSRPAWAQQDKMFSQYMFNMLAVNPAYAGSRSVLSATGLYRNQWGGIPGAPQTATFTLDMPVSQERVGLGLQVYNDRLGASAETGVFATYAYRIRLGDRSTLSLGLQGGAVSFQWNLADAMLNPDGTPDPAFSQNISKILPNFGTGIYLSSDRSYLGASVPQLVKNKLSDFDSGSERAVQRRHAYVMGGFVVGLSDALKLKPSFLVKYAEGAPLGIDGNINLWIADRLAIGGSYRRNQFNSFGAFSSDAIVGMVEVQLSDQIRLGYAYDRMLNNLRSFGPNSHELMLRYEFGFGRSRILTPRYF